MTKLVKCSKPENLDEQHVGQAVTIQGHTLLGRYDTDGNYYEEDTCCGKWWRLVEDKPVSATGCPHCGSAENYDGAMCRACLHDTT